MNNTTIALANLDALSFDQLGILYGILDARARAATTSTGRTRAMNARERVSNEASRRGAVIRQSYTPGVYMCGRPAIFEPIA